MGYIWVTKDCRLRVNQALFDALAAVAFSKQPVKKTSGARHAFEVNLFGSPNSLSRSGVGLRGPRALGHVFGKRFVADRYVYVVRSYLGQRDRNQLFNCSFVHPTYGGMN